MGSNAIATCLLLILIVHMTKTEVSGKDNINCVCKEEIDFTRMTLNCSHQNLTYVPHTAPNIKGLIFSYNNLTNITRKTFGNISNPGNLVELRVDHNNIRNISSDAFDVFPILKYLYLSYNPIYYDNMKDTLGRLSSLKFLNHLDMSGIDTIAIKKDLFASMKENDITSLLLMDCSIETLALDSLRKFDRLISLYLRNNRISELSLFQHSYLYSLYLDNNLLKTFPNFSMNGNQSNCYFQNLEILDLQSNRIDELHPKHFICLPRLRQINIGANPIKFVPDYLLTYLPRFQNLKLNNINGGFLHVYPFAFSSKSLVKLHLGFIGSARTVFMSFHDSFRYIPSLKNLVLERISMFTLTNEEVKTLFAPLKTLDLFYCLSCQISQDPKIFLIQMTNLVNINLRSNLITTLSADTFAANKKLKYLSLRYNKIQHIDVSSFPSALRNQLRQLDFSRNPFVCDCKLEWFVQLMKEIAKKNVLLQYPHEYRCLLPKDKTKMQLSDISFTYKECHPWSSWIWFAIIASPCVLVMIIGFTFLILYRNRWTIKHHLYLSRKKRNYQIINGQNFVFDAFLGYESEDSAFVRRRLLPVLEDEVGLKMCIHERDFQPGVFINDNIVMNMDMSARIILVLSNAFARSSWCMFELKIAHSKLVEDETEVVVILLEKIYGRNMNKAVKYLLQTTTYIEWTEDPVGQELFWTKLKNVLKK